MGNIVSVHVSVLDNEHELCAAALARLVKERSAEAMKQVLQTYQQHFAHEEELLDEHLYSDIKNNGGGGGFSADGSARTSHFEDHKRLIREIVEELQKMDSNGYATASNGFVNRVLRNFEQHANRYDDAYAERLSNALITADDEEFEMFD